MKKVFVSVILSLSLLSVGELLVNPSESKESIKKMSEKELNKQLVQAVKIRDIKSIKELISKGADVNTSILDGLLQGFTPLMFACLNENKDIVDLLTHVTHKV
jgi:ankyrin repeat protein